MNGAIIHPLRGAAVRIERHILRTGGVTGQVGSFGYTRRDSNGGRKMHSGVDLLARQGAWVYAAHSGIVTRADGRDEHGYGNLVKIVQSMEPTGNEVQVGAWGTRYAHLDGIIVNLGAYVTRGERIGRVGRTGNVSAGVPTHLHFELRTRAWGGRWVLVDPMEVFDLLPQGWYGEDERRVPFREEDHV